MKKGIHPNLHDVEYVCACGNTFKGTSTKAGDVIKLDICDKCHPLYTGKKVMVDATGRAEQFKKRYSV
ncbi:MAG: 50S ribosomal protein L31 [Clostridia bacterium]|nr:50S ribosomal protein L31 [Clostridia bacterium]